MSKYVTQPTGRERTFGQDEIIVSKTDPSGRITYVNDVFCRVGQYTEAESIGQPHSMVRHPDMPRAVFKLLWETIQGGSEIFAYVKNLAKSGDHYWVLAHVTPSFDGSGKISGYHSNRRCPDRAALALIEPLYRDLLAEENRHRDRKDGLAASEARLHTFLRERDIAYDRFIFSTLEAA